MTGPLSPNYYSVGQERASQRLYKLQNKKKGRERMAEKKSLWEREKMCASINHIILLLIGLKFLSRHEQN